MRRIELVRWPRVSTNCGIVLMPWRVNDRRGAFALGHSLPVAPVSINGALPPIAEIGGRYWLCANSGHRSHPGHQLNEARHTWSVLAPASRRARDNIGKAARALWSSLCALGDRHLLRDKRQGCSSVVQSCPLLPCGHRSDGERNYIVDLCLTDLPTRTLAVKFLAFSCVIGFLRPARCSAIIFSKCATVISNAGSTKRSPTIGSPSICETATAINSRQRAMLSGE